MPTTIVIPRPTPSECGRDWGSYVAAVPGTGAWPALLQQREEVARRLGALPEDRALHRYAAGKWSIREVLGHITDGERVFAYRALRFARGDQTPLPGFDENAWGKASRAHDRPLGELLDDHARVRAATLSLFRGFSAEEIGRRGTASNAPMSVRGLIYVVAGHERHHMKILKERYLT